LVELLEDRMVPSTFTVVDLGDAGIGSDLMGDLRYAINTANSNADPSNRIEFQPGLTGTIALTQGSLDISKDLEIDGPGQDLLRISGDHRSGVFNITSDPRVQAVTIADLTIADGTGIRVNGRNVGGGLFNDHATVTLSHVVVTGNMVDAGGQGGGIANATGTVILSSSTVSNNAVASGGLGGGGGIATSSGALILSSCTVSGNAGGGGGGILLDSPGGQVVINSSQITDNHADDTNGVGGGIELGGSATITDSTIAENTAGHNGGGIFVILPLQSTDRITVTRSAILGNRASSGGGLYDLTGTVTVDRTTVSGNFVSDPRTGSGLVNGGVDRMTIIDSIISNNTGGSGILTLGQLTISGSTISGNSTLFDGGGLNVAYGDTNVVNSTFSGNTAGEAGGGIALISVAPFTSTASLELTSVTITANVAAGVTSAFHGGGGLQAPDSLQGDSRVFLRNTLIAGNSTASVGPDVNGVVVSLGYNLIGKGDDSTGWASKDHVGDSSAPLEPMLGPLQDNGGPTPTHALLAGSPAIDGGDPRLLGSLDQRGTERFHAGINPPVDVGAFDASRRRSFRILAPAEAVAGEPFTVRVVVLDPAGLTASTFTGTIHFSSTDPDAALPADYTFASADGGMASFSITLQTAGSQGLVVNDVDITGFQGRTTVDVADASPPGGGGGSGGAASAAQAGPARIVTPSSSATLFAGARPEPGSPIIHQRPALAAVDAVFGVGRPAVVDAPPAQQTLADAASILHYLHKANRGVAAHVAGLADPFTEAL
jgi:hypothetical protein